MEDNSSSASTPVSAEAQNETVSQDTSSETPEGSTETPVVAAPSTKKKYKLNVDGKEEDFELDLANDDDVKRHLQMSKASQKRMHEAAQTQQRAEKFIEMLQKDPAAVLSNPSLGVDVRKFAEEYLMKQLQEEMLTPEQRENRDAKQILKERDEAAAKAKEDSEKSQQQKIQDHYAQQYEKDIMTALQTENIPKTAKTVYRMAELMKKNLAHGLELEPKHIAQMVREDYLNEFKEIVGSLDGDTLLKVFGDDTSNKIRKADLARLRGPIAQVMQSQAKEPVRQPKSSERKPMTKEEWKESLERRSKS